jgi:hypothetical protein
MKWDHELQLLCADEVIESGVHVCLWALGTAKRT